MDAPVGDRISRWWAAAPATDSVYLPLVMADSGHRVDNGYHANFTTIYQPLVDLELARPPAAEIEAYWRRIGNQIRTYVRLRNEASESLSINNNATLHVLTWEDAHVGVTSRFVRAAPFVAIAPALAPGSVTTATLDSGDLAPLSWAALHTVALADYRPGGGRAYDMLQAAIAAPADLTLAPDVATVAVDSGQPHDGSVPLHLAGPYVLTWTATTSAPWLAVAPASGTIGADPTVTVLAAGLTPGVQSGTVSFSAGSSDGMSFSRSLEVTAVLAPRVVRMEQESGAASQHVIIPVDLDALGDEANVALSLVFDPSVLGSPQVSAGAGAGAAAVTVDDSQAASGHLGVTLVLPAGQTFVRGTDRLAEVTFLVAASTAGTTSVRFADQPVARAITDATGAALTAAYEDTAVVFPSPAHHPRRHLPRR